jgi:hypothetical protein
MIKHPSLIVAAMAVGLAVSMPAMAIAGEQPPARSKMFSETSIGATIQASAPRAGHQVMVGYVNAPETAWIIVRFADMNGPILGKIRIARGDYYNVAVPLSKATKAGDIIVLTLNAAKTVKFNQKADTQFCANGEPVMAQVTVQ